MTTGDAFVGLRILNKSSRRKILVSFIAIPPNGTHGTAAFPHFMEKHIAQKKQIQTTTILTLYELFGQCDLTH